MPPKKRQEDNTSRVAVRAEIIGRFTEQFVVGRGYGYYFYLVLRLDGQGVRRFEVSPADYVRLKPGDEGGLIYQGTRLITFEPDGKKFLPEKEEEW